MKEKEQRLDLIINALQLKDLSYENIVRYLKQKNSKIKITRRTFQRDIKEIYLKHKIKIKVNRKDGVYYIVRNTEKTEQAISKYNLLTLQNSGRKYNFIKKEKHNLHGTIFIPKIFFAIENNNIIKINYKENWEIERDDFDLEPLAFKEFKTRWYLIAKDRREDAEKQIKNFELSRIKKVELTEQKFEEHNFDIEQHFDKYFGIRTDNDPYEEVILAVEPTHTKYLRAVPLHNSQQILETEGKDEDNIIKLKVHITFDFRQEILSAGWRIEVLKPESFRNEMKNELIMMLGYYQK